jgi:hypothetical protein
MAIKLGNNPKDFKRPVHVVKFDGAKDSITFTFIYRDKRQFAALLDERAGATRAKDEAAVAAAKELDDAGGTPAPVSIHDNYLEWSKDSAEKVLQIANAWDLSEPLSVENLQQLEDEFPGALEEIQSVYQKSVAEVRVKN